MRGFNIAVEAYIKEHGSISEDTYSALYNIFLEWRDPDVHTKVSTNAQVQASLSAMEKRDKWIKPETEKEREGNVNVRDLEQKKVGHDSRIINNLDRYYNWYVLREIEKKLESEIKDENLRKQVYNRASKIVAEYHAEFKNMLKTLIPHIPSLDTKTGNLVVSICDDLSTSLALGVHEKLVKLSEMTSKEPAIKRANVKIQALTDKAKRVLSNAKSATQKSVKITTMAAFVSMVIAVSTATIDNKL